jgi:esterase/lipase superfamily enzyme
MHTEYHRWFSPSLGHDMELRVYGHYGQALMVFPAQDGRFYDFEHFKMIEACRALIDAGRLKVICIDSIDWQSWTNEGVHPGQRARRHNDYDRYVTNEVVPFIRRHCGGNHSIWTTGCSMGAFHAANSFFRHPDCFDGVIALSGLYQPQLFVGDYRDDNIYFNSPLYYLPNISDSWFLDRYRRSKIVFCVGQGAWEGPMIRDTREMERILRDKGIPAWVNFWGHDVAHDWPWWRQQLPFFLNKML